MRLSNLILSLFTLCSLVNLQAQNNNPIELGKVDWIRNFDEGIVKSTKENKPIFLLFQEVPGCSTCRNYGQNVLSHPLIVEAIETLFIPVAIHNNKEGEGAKVLKYYGEPAWNNPVVRIVNAQKQNLINRVNGNYTQLGIVQAMRAALQAEELEMPTYLSLLETELIAEKSEIETATFSMYCFWTGEKEIGKLTGVLETQAGFMNGKEVVAIKYDPSVIEYKKLLKAAIKAQCADNVFTQNKKQIEETKMIIGKGSTSKKGNFRLDKEPKYYLGKTKYRFVPMTQLQAAKVNSRIGQGVTPDNYLSPRQLMFLKEIKNSPRKKWKNAINKDFVIAWKAINLILKNVY